MRMDPFELDVEAWWDGVCEWYNYGNLVRAMEIWSKMVDDAYQFDEKMVFSNDHHQQCPTAQSSPSPSPPLPTATTTTTQHVLIHDQGIISTKSINDIDTSSNWEIQKLQNVLNRISSLGSCKTTITAADGATGIKPSFGGIPQRSLNEEYFLLFLSGCLLDSNDYHTARRFLGYVLVGILQKNGCTNSPTNSTIELLEHTVEEMLASFQEDPTMQKCYWKLQYQCVQWTMQQTNARKWIDPYQRPSYPYRSITENKRKNRIDHITCNSTAVYRHDQHPVWCHLLEEQSHCIITEFDHLYRESHLWSHVGAGTHRNGAASHDGSVVQASNDTENGSDVDRGCGIGRGTWHEVVLAGAGEQPHLAPITYQLLQQYCSDSVLALANAGAGEVIFSLLAPRTRIQPHTASHNLRLTAHLGIRVPKDPELCYLTVANETIHWQVGRVLVFDDSYEHAVVNDSDEIRAVLLMRFWHPALDVTQERNHALEHVIQAQMDDRLRRCNPPLPMKEYDAIKLRGMQRTECQSCGNTGYEYMRVVETTRLFVCVCGTSIQ